MLNYAIIVKLLPLPRLLSAPNISRPSFANLFGFTKGELHVYKAQMPPLDMFDIFLNSVGPPRADTPSTRGYL